jgi:aspartate aminotransferase
LIPDFIYRINSVIEDLITDRTKAILYCSPNNPTGTAFDRQEIELLVRLARERNLFLIADEVYREFVFDGREQLSLLDYMRDLPDRIVVLDSLSKRYSVPGFRLGMMVSMNQELMAGVLRMAMGRLAAGTVDQVAASALNRVGKEEIWAVRDIYQKRRDVVFDALSGVDGVTIQRPEGAFYAVAGLPHEAEAFCAWLLTNFSDPSASSGQEETVMLAPMPGFYATPGKGTHEVRIAYVLEVPKLQRAMEILAKAISAFT